jgi:signal transduction histidine kinase
VIAIPARFIARKLALPQAPLFLQVLSLVLLSLVCAQVVNILIIFSLPPQVPDFYRVNEIVEAFQGHPVAHHDGSPPLLISTAQTPPEAGYITAYARRVNAELARQLKVSPNDIVVASEPPRWLGYHDVVLARQRLMRNAGGRDSPMLIAPFKVAIRQAHGDWKVVRPEEMFPTAWQKRILLWFVLSAVALAPAALWFARRLAAPISAFAAAAERLGRDPKAPPLELDGPAEVERAAIAFNEMQGRLRRYVEDRTDMVAAVAHDLRTPLTRLRFRIEGAPEGLQNKMIADIDQMEAMISATMAFVRDASYLAERRRLELVSLVESVADEMAETGLDVTAEVGPPVVIDGDPIALRRLVNNLLDNAVKFGACARARVYREDSTVIIEVDDDGPGIPEAERERVFEPFHRGEPSRSRETGGAGLGLAVVRSVARAHGGDANLQNRSEGGLRARAHLPL